ncbi:deoxyguanosinetriphosphate triphosphohydrolase [Alteromonas sediminis]|uniref:Deoxyguanosinetriphosphate triphosphohydrolase n=1 Tax=Alteromonas sediminis TaxID=2259342 RepID=A0A3N5YP23_9ALTE|nr:deoxyguanosinetriphosphate triphosphohydrolase [Alteromonas sediminis]RPJ67521.1 deoxyguanosinetriphosphate triphosphohydrolase [Alteromonas sediminis]
MTSTNVLQLPVTCSAQGVENQKRWSYLIADSVAFNKDIDYGIRIQKPNEEKVPQWISKLITSGKCNSIYVENLHLKDSEHSKIEKLCHRHNVSLFSLSVVQPSETKVVKGPW